MVGVEGSQGRARRRRSAAEAVVLGQRGRQVAPAAASRGRSVKGAAAAVGSGASAGQRRRQRPATAAVVTVRDGTSAPPADTVAKGRRSQRRRHAAGCRSSQWQRQPASIEESSAVAGPAPGRRGRQPAAAAAALAAASGRGGGCARTASQLSEPSELLSVLKRQAVCCCFEIVGYCMGRFYHTARANPTGAMPSLTRPHQRRCCGRRRRFYRLHNRWPTLARWCRKRQRRQHWSHTAAQTPTPRVTMLQRTGRPHALSLLRK